MTAAITPGMRVTLLVSDRPDPVTATVTRVYTDAIGQEVAEYTRTDGEAGIQCTRFLTPADADEFWRGHYFPEPEELGGDPENFPAGWRGDCGCGMSFREFDLYGGACRA